MIKLNLVTNSKAEEIIKTYLEENVSETLAEKINNGVAIQKDNKTLINKKTLSTFMAYAQDEARKLAENNKNYACVQDDIVFSWAIHYFEEDQIEGVLHNEDGSEYKKVVTKTTPKPQPVSKPTKSVKPQLSLFDLLNDNTDTSLKTPDNAVKQEDIEVEPIESATDTDISKENEPQNIEAETIQIVEETNEEKHWIDEHAYVDNNGVVHELETTETDIKLEILNKLKSLLGEQIIVR